MVSQPAQGVRPEESSPSWVEQLIFGNRWLVLALCAVATALSVWQLPQLRMNASFERTIPTGHPYIANFLAHKSELAGLGNSLRIAVAAPGDSIYDANYLRTLQRLSDEVFLLPGVDRAYMKSLWTPSTRWIAVTEDGMEGGPVIPNGYDGSAASIEKVRANVERSGEIGFLVANDRKSSVIFVPLLATDTTTGKPLDYAQFSAQLEELRAKYEGQGVKVHITGFAKVVGDLMDGLAQFALYFALAIVIAAAVLYWYSRCARSTLLVVTCSLAAVLWQLALLPALGYQLDPYSILVPFLVFAIGMSHGAQKMNGIMQDIGRGAGKELAARYTFRRLFLAGLTALLCDAVGFAVLLLIDIQAIRDLALIASLGVAILIFTNLILLPVLLSYVGVAPSAARRSLAAEQADAQGSTHPVWRSLGLFTRRGPATAAVALGAVLLAVGYAVSLQLKIGDLSAGAPELREDSRYNRDSAFMRQHYGASSDVFAVMVKTPEGSCNRYDTVMRLDALEWRLQQLPGVESTNSMSSLARRTTVGLNEGNLRWYDVLASQGMMNTVTARSPRGVYNDACNLLTLYVYLTDHKAQTLETLVGEVEAFAAANDTQEVKFLLAAGSAGIEAATNMVVKKATVEMLWLVYAAVIALCMVVFRSWRAVLCAVVPLVITSVLCEALMVALDIGVKVATLPVIALGVGIGIDYALYVMSIMLARIRAGESLQSAYASSLLFTGRVVTLTGVTLAIGVFTWAFSPIKFQADMGILLAFMFLWNMVGALVLLPALACFAFPQAARRSQGSAPGTPAPATTEAVHKEQPCAHQVAALTALR